MLFIIRNLILYNQEGKKNLTTKSIRWTRKEEKKKFLWILNKCFLAIGAQQFRGVSHQCIRVVESSMRHAMTPPLSFLFSLFVCCSWWCCGRPRYIPFKPVDGPFILRGECAKKPNHCPRRRRIKSPVFSPKRLTPWTYYT